MNYILEKLSTNQIKLEFTIDAETFEKALQETYIKNRTRINVPGFRKGKAPRALIENMYGNGVFYDDAFEIVSSKAYGEAIDKEELTPVDRPKVVDISQMEAGKELKFSVEVYVKPEVELGEYKNLDIEIYNNPITTEQIDARIKQDQEKNARIIDVVDRAVIEKDIVNLDYTGSIDGVALDGGTASDQTLEIGSGTFIPGFEEQLVGMKISEEKDIEVTFPEDYGAKDLAGKKAVFHIKINNIQNKELPLLDDEFAMDVSEFDTLDEYKKDIEGKLLQNEEKRKEIETENKILQAAVNNAKIDIPSVMIDDQVENMIQQMRYQLSYQGINLEEYLKYMGKTLEETKESYKDEAEQRIKTELVLEEIIKKESLIATDEQIEAKISQEAEHYGQSVEKFKEKLTQQQRKFIAENAVIQVAIDLMKETANIVETEKIVEKSEA